MKNLRLISLVLLLAGLVLVIAACGGDKATSAPAATTVPATSKPANTPVPAATQKPADTPVPTPVPTSAAEEELAPDQVTQVSDMNSYRAAIDIQWQGTMTNSQKIESSMKMQIEYVREPRAEHLSIYGTSFASQGFTEDQPLEMYTVGDTTYMYVAGMWMQTPSGDSTEGLGDTFLMTSDDVLKNAKNSKYVGREKVNGVDTKHYTFDETALQSADMAGSKIDRAEGDVWIAVDGSYVVKMDATMYGKELSVPAETGSEVTADGSMRMVMNVTDVNKPITIEVPQEALDANKPPEDIPVPDDAADVSNLFGMITYTTAKTPQEIHDFYKAEMPKNGWTETGDDSFGDMFMMQYTKDGSTASVTITADATSGKTSVMITVQEPE